MTVFFHAFVSPTLNFEKKKDNLYVVFGPERDDWDCNLGCVMKYYDSNRYFLKNSQAVLTCYFANSFKVYIFFIIIEINCGGDFCYYISTRFKKKCYIVSQGFT